MQSFRDYLSVLCYDFFLAGVFVFMTSAFLDTIFPGFVSRVINVKYIVALGIIGLVGMVIFPPKTSSRSRVWMYIGVGVVAVWLAVLSYYMIPRDDSWRLLISLGVGASVLLAGFATEAREQGEIQDLRFKI